jgi:hypothetical protein
MTLFESMNRKVDIRSVRKESAYYAITENVIELAAYALVRLDRDRDNNKNTFHLYTAYEADIVKRAIEIHRAATEMLGKKELEEEDFLNKLKRRKHTIASQQ